MRKVVTRALAVLGELPPIRAARARLAEHRFLRRPGSFRGVYPTFDEARRFAPMGVRLGYDHPESAQMYRDQLDRVATTDYPHLFWLSRLLPDCTRVFDFGGHVGLSFYAYRRYLTYPALLRWTVCEVPAVAEEGARLAAEKREQQLSFTTRIDNADGAEVFIALGSLQYVEEPLWIALSRLQRKPPHLLLSRMPLTEGASFVTLQNTLHSYNPYRVQNRGELVTQLERLGYDLVDCWQDLERSCILPLDPGRSVLSYSGLYLRLR